MLIVAVLVFAGLLGLLAFFSSLGGPREEPSQRSSRAKKGSSAKKAQKAKVRRSAQRNGASASGGMAAGEVTTAAASDTRQAHAESESSERRLASISSDSEKEEEGEGDAHFLGLDDVLPATRGAYVVEGELDETAGHDSLWDGWETVDPVKYNIPRGNKLTAQGVPSTATQPRPRAPSSAGSKAPGKTKNEKRREKEKLVRSIQQTRPAGSAVAQRIGSAGTKRQQQDPTMRAASHVPGM